MTHRDGNNIRFTDHQVEVFKVPPVTTVKDALAIAIGYEQALSALNEQADELSRSDWPQDRNTAMNLRIRAGSLGCFARGIRGHCLPSEIADAELHEMTAEAL